MNVPLKIFYHCYAINNWLQIAEEQMNTIVECGLYDEVEGIYVGFLGDAKAWTQATIFFNKYPKVTIESYSPDGKRYEFHTLGILKKHSDESPQKFYGFYIHQKGVSYTQPEFVMAGKFWRDYLMHWVIKNWKHNYKALDMKFMGYDIVGCKAIPARVSANGRTHLSGNMFAFNSEYIRSLKPLETVNTSDRFEAEAYPYSGQPLIYIGCNIFVDYLCQQPSYDDFINNYKDLPDFCL